MDMLNTRQFLFTQEQPKPVKDNPAKQGEIPRKPDDSQDDRKDPFKAS